MKILSNYKNLLKKHGVKPSKRLGQNFLIDKNVLKKIIRTANLSPEDVVLEVGPGLGILTQELAKGAKQVIAVEKDKRMCEILAEVLNAGNVRNVRIVNQDILKFDPYTLCPKSYTLIANLPYYLTTPAIRKFLETKNPPQEIILVIQKEVAQRITAKPGKMSILTVSVQFYAEPKIISYVSKESFWPQPKVDSAIIKIVPKRWQKDINTELFFKIVKAGFSSKRKMLKNNLKLDESILKKLGLNPKVRAENLSIQDWLKIYESYKFYKK